MKHISNLLLVVLAILISAVFTVPTAFGNSPLAEPGNDQGHFVAEDALAQFNALKHHGEALGWALPEANGAPDPSLSDHYQGLVRYPGTGTPIFYITQKDDDDHGLSGGYLHIVRFGTRATDGERLRSNLQQIGSDTKHTPPNSNDTWLHSIRFNGSVPLPNYEWLPAYVHPGGMAIVDDILFMAIDTRVHEHTPTGDDIPIGQIVLFDLRPNLLNPIPIHALPLDHSIDNLAVTRQEDGKYLVFANGDGGEMVIFYRTNGTDLRDDNLSLGQVQIWDDDSSADYDGKGEGWPGGEWDPPHTGGDSFKAHQSSTFLRESDGSLYLIGMRHSGLLDTGGDYADLYKVDSKTSGGFKLTRLKTRNFHCEYDMGSGTDGRICNFAAANNAYVTPSGELILYSIPHDDEDHGVGPVDFVRLGEFRHRDVNIENSSLRLPSAIFSGPFAIDEGSMVVLNSATFPAADRPWVELYDDDHWSDRSIVVDYDDRALLELNNFNNLDGFNDKTSSIRWRLPVGLDVELFVDDNFRSRRIILRGTGQTEFIADLNSQVVIPGIVEHPGRNPGDTLDFNDTTSSMRFLDSNVPAPLYYQSWDLDGDGIFNETGTSATGGDEVGRNPTFSAAGLDGPSEYTIKLRVTSADGIFEDSATITVMNVAPARPDAGADITLDEGSAIILNGSDNGNPTSNTDPITFEWDYDYDGVNFDVDATGLTPLFPSSDGPVTFTVALRANDGDGGLSPIDTAQIQVLNVAPTTPDAGSDLTVDEGSNVIPNASGSIDPAGDADPLTYEWDFDYDGVNFDVDAANLQPTFTGLDGPATFIMAVRAKDDDGGISEVDTAIVQVNNVLPTANAGDDLVVAEGTTTVIDGTGSSDPADDADPITYEWDFDYDGVTFDVDATGAMPDFSSIDGPSSFTIALRVSDDDTTAEDVPNLSLDTAFINVLNVAPVPQIDMINDRLEDIGLIYVPVDLNGSFDDVLADTHTAVIEWGDGTSSPALVDDAVDSVTATYTYLVPGEWNPVLTVTDDDGDIGSTALVPRAITVYDNIGAVGFAIEQIDFILPTVPIDTQAVLQSARNYLAGHPLGSTGALEDLQTNQPVLALQKIGYAIPELDQAIGLSSTPGDLMHLLALTAQSTAQIALEEAIIAIGTKPTSQQQQALDQTELFIVDGIVALTISDYVMAVNAFESATDKAINLLP